ncbi:hypothetical protein FR837_23505 (plasmid) [Enterobacter hormaechei]|nr:hypothetical protein FR837_23505 [Enterobacter hormaechei]QFI03042.1 hypothetical protein FR758_23575 [Enterobacter hormaechei]
MNKTKGCLIANFATVPSKIVLEILFLIAYHLNEFRKERMRMRPSGSLVGKEAAADTLIGNCTTARPASRSNSS